MDFSLAGNAASPYAPLLAPMLLGVIALGSWIYYLRAHTISKKKGVLLEILVPKDTKASLNLMDGVILSLHQMGRRRGAYLRFFTGAARPRFSLEIAGSGGGEIRFFIWMEREYKETIRTAILMQHPEFIVKEAVDYTREMRDAPKRK